MNNLNLKTLGLIFSMVLMGGLQTLNSQTYYSTFNTPSNGTNYSYSVNGLCVGCFVSNPSHAASMPLNDSSRMYMLVGLGNSIRMRTHLNGTANSSGGVVVGNNTGLLNVALLSGMVVRTYMNGTLQETFAGGALLTLSLFSGSKQCVNFHATQPYDEVSFEVNNLLSLAWDINYFYAFGSNFVPLPVDLLSFKSNKLDNSKLKLDWSVAQDLNLNSFEIYHSIDGVNYQSINTVLSAHNYQAIESYSVVVDKVNKGNNFFKIKFNSIHHEEEFSAPIVVDFNESLNVNFFPNPVQSDFRIQSNQEISSVQVFNQVGALVSSIDAVNASELSMNSIDWPIGTYVVLINGVELCNQTYYILKTD